jgi:hypothetical protein
MDPVCGVLPECGKAHQTHCKPCEPRSGRDRAGGRGQRGGRACVGAAAAGEPQAVQRGAVGGGGARPERDACRGEGWGRTRTAGGAALVSWWEWPVGVGVELTRVAQLGQHVLLSTARHQQPPSRCTPPHRSTRCWTPPPCWRPPWRRAARRAWRRECARWSRGCRSTRSTAGCASCRVRACAGAGGGMCVCAFACERACMGDCQSAVALLLDWRCVLWPACTPRLPGLPS